MEDSLALASKIIYFNSHGGTPLAQQLNANTQQNIQRITNRTQAPVQEGRRNHIH